MTKSIKEKRRLQIINECHALNKPVPVECIKLKMSYNPYSSLNANQKVINKILPCEKPYFKNSSKFIREYLGVDFRNKVTSLMHNIANSMKVYNFKFNISYYGSDENGYISFATNLINKHGNPIGSIYLDNEVTTVFRYSAQYSNEPDLPTKGTLTHYADALSELFTEQLSLKRILNVNPSSKRMRNGIKIPNKKHQDLIEKIHKYRISFYKEVLHRKDRLNIHVIYSDKATWHISSRGSKYQNKDIKLLESFDEIEFIKSLINIDEVQSSLEIEDLLMSNIEYIKETIKMENY